jgi:hypothetical protein
MVPCVSGGWFSSRFLRGGVRSVLGAQAGLKRSVFMILFYGWLLQGGFIV